MAERCLTHDPLGHHTTGDGNGFSLQLLKLILDVLAVVGYVKLYNLERVLALCLQRCQLVPTNLPQLVNVLLLLLGLNILFLFTHILFSLCQILFKIYK